MNILYIVLPVYSIMFHAGMQQEVLAGMACFCFAGEETPLPRYGLSVLSELCNIYFE